ncbi:cell surface protein [Campylobacter fetus subsp. testudinum]|nr:cell surface protein [Campylobacter fetus subsp. testudinum]
MDLKSNFTGLDSNGVIKGVEKMELSNSSLSVKSFDAKGIDGLQTVALSGEKGISVTNLANIVDLEVSGFKGNSLNLDTIYAEKVLDGDSDVQNLILNNVGKATDKGGDTNSVAIASTKAETLAITTKGSASFIKGVSNKDVSVKGSADLTLKTADGVNSLDASSFTGVLDADLSLSTKLNTVKGGNGNDKITIGTNVANISVDGGAGNDELVIKNTAAKTIKPTIANFEKVTLDSEAKLVLAMDNASSVSELNIAGNTGGITVANSAVSSLNFLSTATGTNANAVKVDSANLNTINYKTDASSDKAVAVKGYVEASKAADVAINIEKNVTTASSDNTVVANEATNIALNVAETKAAQAISITAPKAVSLSINNKSVGGLEAHLGTNGSVNTAVENLTVTTDGAFTFATNNTFEKAALVTLNGDNAKSAVTIGNIGSVTAEHDVQVTASGLKAGLKVGSIITKENSINVDVSAVTGTVTLGAMSGSNVTVNANSSASLTLGAITAAESATIDAGSINGAVVIGAVTAKTANIDLSKALDTIAVGKVTADTINYNGSTLKANGADGSVNLASGTGKSFTAVVNGSLSDDKIKVAASDTTESIKVSGNLDIGSDEVAITAGAKTNSVDISELKATNLSGTVTLGSTTASNVTLKLGNFASNVVWELGSTLTTSKLSGDVGSSEDNLIQIAAAAATGLTTIDIEALTGNFKSVITLTNANSNVITVKGSEKNFDTLSLDGSSAADFSKLDSVTNIDKIDVSGTDAVTLNYKTVQSVSSVDMINQEINKLTVKADDTATINLSKIYGDATDTVTTELNAATTGVTLGTSVVVQGASNKVKDIIQVNTTASSKEVITINGFDTDNDKINFSVGVTDKGGLTSATEVDGVQDSDKGGTLKIKVATGTDLISFLKNDGTSPDSTFVATDDNIKAIAAALNGAINTTGNGTDTVANGIYIVQVSDALAGGVAGSGYSYVINIGTTSGADDDTIIKVAGVADLTIVGHITAGVNAPVETQS